MATKNTFLQHVHCSVNFVAHVVSTKVSNDKWGLKINITLHKYVSTKI